ncbi:MAG: hypothetical protein ACI4R8_03165 [Candidatus Caccovivens sp.]
MFDKLFLVLISVFVPIIIFAGCKVYNCKSYKKLLTILTLVLLGGELIRFFCNATLYTKAVTPSEDIKFHFITILCIISLFATFNKGKLGNFFKNVFCLTALAPIIYGLFNSQIFINALDSNAVCKVLYMIECGLVLAIALFYTLEFGLKINAWHILWSALVILAFAGIDALTIYYWEIAISFDLIWYLAHAIAVVAVPICFALNRLYFYIKAKKQRPNEKIAENTKEKE